MKLASQFVARVFPRGDYWITDPCYLYPKDEWRDFCGQYFTAAGRSGVHEYSGHQFFVWSTAYGDGLYPVVGPNKNGSAGVDSGLLAIIPQILVEKWGELEEAHELEKRLLACSIRTPRKFEIEEKGGDVFFLNYFVDTSGFSIEDEEDEEEPEDDEDDEGDKDKE
jgi:hypothetical protein